MKLLLRAVLRRKRHVILLALSLFAILGLTVASQAEIFSLGILVKPGPDAFLLFGRKHQEKLVKTRELSKECLFERWEEISQGAPTLSVSQANAYVAKYDAISPSLTKRLHKYMARYCDFACFHQIALLLIVVACIKAIFLFSQRFLNQLIAIRVSCSVRKDYFKALQRLPLSFFHSYDMGNLSSRVITDSSNIAVAVNALLTNYIQAPVTLALALIVCVSISWKFSFLVCTLFPLCLFPIILVARRLKQIAKRIQHSQDRFLSSLFDFLLGIVTIKVFNSESFTYARYRKQNEAMAALEEKSAAIGLLPRPLLHTVSSLFFAAVIIIGLYHFHIAPEELLVFCGLLYLVYDPIKKFADENANIVRGCAAAERFYEVIAHPDLQEEPTLHVFSGLQQEIRFHEVSFGYHPHKTILSKLSFVVKKGEAIGIVGPTGSGKTTLIKLLPRLYEPFSGEIFLDTIPLQAYSKSSLRSHIGCVLQDPFLFYDTIWNNLTCGRDFSEEEVIYALKRAHAYEFVANLPQGLHTLLEESGKNLSGGQQQRLTIARALLKQASILILDEATSALDAVNENHIKEIIGELKGNCTQIIIAHKLSTLEYVDRIIYLENGYKLAEGTMEELLQTCQEFREMYQFSNTSPSLFPV